MSQGLPTLAPPCKLVRDASDRLRIPRSTAILRNLSKTDCVVLITWSPSGYPPVRPEYPDSTVLFTNHNVTACKFTQLFCLDVAQGHMKWAPNETRTHSCRFACRAC